MKAAEDILCISLPGNMFVTEEKHFTLVNKKVSAGLFLMTIEDVNGLAYNNISHS